MSTDLRMLDILSTPGESVEILIRQDGKVVWVNVAGICRLRIGRINSLTLNDERHKPLEEQQ